MAFTKIVSPGIDTTGSYTVRDLNAVGVLTASALSGPLTGNATGLTGTPDIAVANITATGNVSIGGTLTYEDVTNIDSVGIITAQAGVKVPDSQKVLLGTGDDLEIFHNGGQVNESFVDNKIGNLNIRNFADDKDIVIKSDNGSGGLANYILCDGSTGAVELSHYGSLKLSTAAGGVNIGGNLNLNGADNYEIRLGANNDLKLYHDGSNSRIKNTTGSLWLQSDTGIRFTDSGVNESMAAFYDNGAVELYYDGTKKFETTSAGLKIHEDTNKVISFSGGIGEIGNVTGFQAINTAASSLVEFGIRATDIRFATGSAERVRITSNGLVGIGTDNPDNYNPNADDLVIFGTGHQGLTIRSGTSHDGSIMFNDTDNANQRGIIRYIHTDDAMAFHTSSGEALRINSVGNIGVNNDAPLYPLHFKNAMASTPSYIHMQVTGTNTVGGGGGIAFDTSASNDASNNGLYLATIKGIRNSADNGSNDLVFSTSAANVAGDDGNTHSPKEKLRITSDGKVLINTTTNDDNKAKLVVEGTTDSGSIITGRIHDSTNTNNRTVLLHRMNTGQGFQFSGDIMTNSWTGNAKVNCHITVHYSNQTVEVDVVNATHSSQISKTNLRVVTADYGSYRYLGIQKNGGGTGVFYINAFVGNNIVNTGNGGIREVSNSSLGSVTNVANLN